METLNKQIETLNKQIEMSLQIQNSTFHYIRKLNQLQALYENLKLNANHKNPLNSFGLQCFSQNEEDGITLEIVRRLNIHNGTYVEFGVESGVQNNTLILATMGWSGFWIGNQDLAFNWSQATKFAYLKNWVTLENVSSLVESGLQTIQKQEIDFFSLDLDGNDYHFVEKILADLSEPKRPKILVLEYNAKFIPPARFLMTYNPNHRWMGDDYFGCSLVTWLDLLVKYGYKLVCCGAQSGANAFFVREEFANLFADVPKDIRDIFVPARYVTSYLDMGHKVSPKTIEEFMNR
ncbi:MAG: hypothetical protein QM520_01335 [Gammaproteobacteria bacterium]|nr:hypothetical protein [Gammaproteobacteria bacterium]